MSKKKDAKTLSKSKSPKSSIKKKAKKSTGPDKKIIVGFKTVSLDMRAWHDPNYTYTVGKEHVVNFDSDYEKDMGRSCGKGLHFSPTEQKTYQYTNDKQNFLVLEVQANVSDVLGHDSEKYRVSKLKVNKVLRTVTRYGDEWKAAEKEVTALPKTFLLPQKDVTPASIKAAVTAYGKAIGVKSIKCHIVENPYEASVLSDKFARTLTYCHSYANAIPEMPMLGIKHLSYNLNEIARSIASNFLLYKEGGINNYQPAKTVAANETLFAMLKMGVLPIAYAADKKTLAVWVPKENPFTTKSSF